MPLRAGFRRLTTASVFIIASATDLGAPVAAHSWVGDRSAGPKTSIVAFLFTFHGPDGANPTGRLVADGRGALYGTTLNGGAYNAGAVFKLSPAAGHYTEEVLHSFQGPPGDGANPQGGVILANGTIYGTTLGGGSGSCGSTGGCGTVFAITQSGTGYQETVLHAFQGGHNDGAIPGGDLVIDPAGVIYGATGSGGLHDRGTVFRLASDGPGYTMTLLHNFGAGGDGQAPTGLTGDGNGVLFGVTGFGGKYHEGTAFALTPQGPRYHEAVLHSFGGPGDGARPSGQLALDRRGALFGTTEFGRNGAAQCCGTAFKLTPAGAGYDERLVFDFQRGSGGIAPSPLVEKKEGVLYGTAADGGRHGSHGRGTVFELMPTGGHYTELVLHDFLGGRDGANPSGALLTDRLGALYGVTANGGGGACTRGCGLVFELTH